MGFKGANMLQFNNHEKLVETVLELFIFWNLQFRKANLEFWWTSETILIFSDLPQ